MGIDEGYTTWAQELSEQVADDAEDPLERIEAEDFSSRHHDLYPFAPCASRVVEVHSQRRGNGPSSRSLLTGDGPELSGGTDNGPAESPPGGRPDSRGAADTSLPREPAAPRTLLEWEQAWERYCWGPDA